MEVKTAPQVDPAEEWYNQKDSSYLRIQFVEGKGYRITVRNEFLIETDPNLELDPNVMAMSAVMRALAHIVLDDPNQMYEMGLELQAQDYAEVESKLSTEDQDLLAMPSKGNA